MILNDGEIHYRCWNEDLIDPYLPECVGPSTADLHLGHEFARVLKHTEIDTRKQDVAVEEWRANSILLYPGETALATTEEWVNMPLDLQGQVSGRSSLGRIFVQVHQTAGIIDPGFEGEITLELKNTGDSAVRLHAGDRICQITFHQMKYPANNGYDGSYQHQTDVRKSAMIFDDESLK